MRATVLLTAICACAAFVASWAAVPLPFLLGPLMASAAISLSANPHLPKEYSYLNGLRFVFTAVIGLLIGTQVTPDLFENAQYLVKSAVALTLFVVISLAFNYTVFRRLGHYDHATAFYASMPGGLYESIAFGEEAGADPARLMLQQFLRVIVVVTILPIGLSLWIGAPVGSSGGMTLAKPDVPWQALPIALIAIATGIGLGKLLRFPARQLTGPMAVGAALSLSGMIDIDIPQWLINLALIVVGTALGTRFTGVSRRRLAQGVGLAVVSVGGMLLVAALFAWVLSHETGQRYDMLLVAFAPGGVTEMTLVALSLTGNPAIVTLHHIFRILITVAILIVSSRWMKKQL